MISFSRIANCAAMTTFCCLLVSPLWCEPVASRTMVTQSEIRTAILRQMPAGAGRAGVSVEEIELPADVSAAADRTLRLVSASWDASRNRGAFRMECQSSAACLPFLVYGRIDHARFQSIALALSASNRASHRPTSAKPRPVLHSGDRAQVVFRGSRMQLSCAVVCLENGAEGEIIRVRNEDGHVFRARISTAGILEALPQ